MWWVKSYQLKDAIIIWEFGEIKQNIRVDAQSPSVAKGVFFSPLISKNHIGALPVKPHHSATTAWVKNTLLR